MWEVRVIKNIKEGEEITINYILAVVKATSERKLILKESFNFDCTCRACNISEQEKKDEKILCEKFHGAEAEMRVLKMSQEVCGGLTSGEILRKEVDCIKSMYKTAKVIGVLGKTALLDLIGEGFSMAIEGCMEAGMSEMIDSFKKDAEAFSKVGVKLAAMVYGEEYPVTLSWKKNQDDLSNSML